MTIAEFEVTYPTLAVDNSGKVRVIKFGEEYSSPGTCVVCGGTLDPGKVFIDFGLTIEYHGAVYICNYCFVDVMSTMRYIPLDGDHYKELYSKHLSAVAKIKQLEAEKKQLEIRALDVALNRIRDSITGMVSDPGSMESASGKSQGKSGTSSASNESKSAGSGPVGSVNGPTNEQGHSGVLDFADLEDLDF